MAIVCYKIGIFGLSKEDYYCQFPDVLHLFMQRFIRRTAHYISYQLYLFLRISLHSIFMVDCGLWLLDYQILSVCLKSIFNLFWNWHNLEMESRRLQKYNQISQTVLSIPFYLKGMCQIMVLLFLPHLAPTLFGLQIILLITARGVFVLNYCL